MRSLFVFSLVAFLVAGRAVAASVASVSFSPDTVVGGLDSSGTVTLDSPAPAGGLTVALVSNSPAAQVPASILVGPGQNSASFAANTSSVKDQVLVTITATASGISKAGSLTINPVFLSSVAVNPPVVSQGDSAVLTVTLNGPAPTGGTKVQLNSTVREASVPGALIVPAGQSSATFTIKSKFLTDPQTATITASLGYVETTASLTVNPIGPSNITLTPASVNGKLPATGTVNLYSPAGKDGMVIDLGSSSGVAKVPSSVKIPAGQSSATFPIATIPVSILSTSNITAKFEHVVRASTLSVLAPTIATVAFTPPTVAGGTPASGLITLSFEAPPHGLRVQISSDNPNVTVPEEIAIPAGKTTATFKAKTVAIAVSKPANIKVLLNAAGPTTALPVTAPVMTSLKLTAPTVVGQKDCQAIVTIGSPAPDGGLDIAVASSDKNAIVPKTVTVQTGKTSAKFNIKTSKVKAATPVTITLTLNAAPLTAPLTINPN